MKKNIFVITIFIVILYYLVSLMTETESTPALVKNMSKNEITNHRQKNKNSTNTKRSIKKNISKSTKVNKFESLYPCDIKPSEGLWRNLPKDHIIYRYELLKEKLDKLLTKKKLTSKDFDKLEQMLDQHLNDPQYPAYDFQLIDRIEALKGQPHRKNQIIRIFEDRMEGHLGEGSLLEHSLTAASYFHEKKNFKKSKQILLRITKEDHSNSLYSNLYHNVIEYSKTPNQLAASFAILKEIPSLDFRFLIDLKQKNKSKTFQRALDLASYEVALKINSQSKILTKRHGSYEKLFIRAIKKEEAESLYKNQECDDREFIELCEHHCEKPWLRSF